MKNLQSLDIKKIVTAITSIVETLFIYQYRDFLIIICSYSYQGTWSKKKKALLNLAEKENFTFQLFSLDYYQEQIKLNNPFFLLRCIREQLVFKNETNPETTVDQPYYSAELLEAIKLNFKIELEKAISFNKGVPFYKEQSNLKQACFMLHQYIELLYRSAGLFLLGKAKVCHSIAQQQQYVLRFYRELRIFNIEYENDNRILILLDKSYIAARYEEFTISLEDLEVIQTKAAELEQNLRKALNNCFHEIQVKILTAPVLNSTNHPTPSEPKLVAVLKTLKHELDLHTAYLMGSRIMKIDKQNHFKQQNSQTSENSIFTLVVITNNDLEDSISTIMDRMNCQLQDCKVFLIQYTVMDVSILLDRGYYFLQHCLDKALPVYSECSSSFKRYEISYYEQTFEKILKVWQTHYDRASYFMETLVDPYGEMPEGTITKLQILHTAIKQVCLGMLYVFWEYKPIHYALDYLLHLCSNFSSAPDVFIFSESFSNQYSYELLRTAPRQLKRSTSEILKKEDIETAFKVTENFMAKAHGEVGKELERLRKIHCVEVIV